MVTTNDQLAAAVARRLKQLVATPGMRQRILSQGVPSSTLQRLSGGKNVPQTDSLVRIAEAANVSLDWLAGLTDDRDPVPEASSVGMISRVSAAVPDGFVAVPTFNVQASAGNGSLASSPENEEADLVAFREVWLRSLGFLPGRVHILWASGDSMNPTIRDGDMLLVDRTIDRVVNDGIYVVVAAGAVRVKRISIRQNGSVLLRSDNDRYEAETIPSDEVPSLIVEGRVRWVGGPI